MFVCFLLFNRHMYTQITTTLKNDLSGKQIPGPGVYVDVL